MNDDEILRNLLAFNSLLNSTVTGERVSLEQLDIFYNFLKDNQRIAYLVYQLYNNFKSTTRTYSFVPVPDSDVIDSYTTGDPLIYVSTYPAGFISFLNTTPDEDTVDNNELIAIFNEYRTAVASVPLEPAEIPISADPIYGSEI